MKESRTTPWMRVSGELRKDAPFFMTVGLLCGIVQDVGYRYFDKANWGSDLLQEHIAFNSMLLAVMFLWTAKGLLEWQSGKREMKGVQKLVDHVMARTVGFASVGASVVFGFGIAVTISGAYMHASISLLFCIYLVSVAEVAANPLLGKGHSKTYLGAMAVIVALPIAFRSVI